MLMTVFSVAESGPTGPSGVSDVDGPRSISRPSRDDPRRHRFPSDEFRRISLSKANSKRS